jgi:hypothetical protein
MIAKWSITDFYVSTIHAFKQIRSDSVHTLRTVLDSFSQMMDEGRRAVTAEYRSAQNAVFLTSSRSNKKTGHTTHHHS